MSIASFFAKLFGATVQLSATQKAVAALKTTSVGSVVAAEIKTLSSATLSGEEKFAQALATALPLIQQFLTSKGAAAVAIDDVEDIGRELVQSLYNDLLSTSTSKVVSFILSLFK